MIRENYSAEALKTHIDIQNINDSLQLYIDEFYNNIDNSVEPDPVFSDISYDNNYKDFKTKILALLESLNDVSIEYFNRCKSEFENYDDESRFQLSSNLETLLKNYFDVINADLTTADLPKITNEVIIKYIQINVVYENIIQSLDELDMFDNYYDKRFYTVDNILTILDYIINGFYGCMDDLRMLCKSEQNVLSMVQCYVLNLKIVMNIIEFIESIKYIGH